MFSLNDTMRYYLCLAPTCMRKGINGLCGEMLLETYRMAKARKDTKTMERAAASYAKYNRVDLEDEQALPYDMIVVQPFTATSDPTVLGLKPIPNLQSKIDKLLAKYRAETIDIEDIEYEEADLEESIYFPTNDETR